MSCTSNDAMSGAVMSSAHTIKISSFDGRRHRAQHMLQQSCAATAVIKATQTMRLARGGQA